MVGKDREENEIIFQLQIEWFKDLVIQKKLLVLITMKSDKNPCNNYCLREYRL